MKQDEEKGAGSGTAGRGIENEGTGSLRVPDQRDRKGNVDPSTEGGSGDSRSKADREGGSGSTKGGTEPGVSGKRGVTGGTEKEGEGHSGPIRSGGKRDKGGESPHTEQDRAEGGAREGYEDHGNSRDDDGSGGESSGSRPGYR